MVGQEHMPTWLVWERFTRLANEVAAVKNERDVAHATEAKAREWERIPKRKAEKSKLALQIAEDNVYKYRLAIILSWTIVRVFYQT
ncbi:hypothetical protein CFP56_012982 [Quercus suber]|uniref:Remorin C-terminal domain-containing protein n=1 Tax=Quercus suber TaxID=58331 RepID=A0AAW0KXC5_QUESU